MALGAFKRFIFPCKVLVHVRAVRKRDGARLNRREVLEIRMPFAKRSELLGMAGLATLIGNRLQVMFATVMFDMAASANRLPLRAAKLRAQFGSKENR